VERYLTRARAGALFALLHPGPVAATVVAGAAFAAVAAGGAPPADRLGLFVGSVLLTQIAISVYNDYCDRDLDAIAKPERAIPSGALAPADALRLAAAALVGGLLLSLPLGPLPFALGAIGTGAGLVYSGRLKRTAWSWLPFALGFPTLALWGYAAVDRWDTRLWTGYALGLPLVLAIHLADTLPDLADDSGAGLRGLAHRLGPSAVRTAIPLALAAGAALAAGFGASAPPLVGAAVATAATAGLLARGRDDAVRYGAGLTAALLALGWLGGLSG
jgi:4-hydroxybenzoate polyprenyltransferase